MRLSILHILLDFVDVTDVEGNMVSWSVQLNEKSHVIRNSIGIFSVINQKFILGIELVSSLIERNKHRRMLRLSIMSPNQIPDSQIRMVQLVKVKKQDHLLDEGVVLIHHHG